MVDIARKVSREMKFKTVEKDLFTQQGCILKKNKTVDAFSNKIYLRKATRLRLQNL